MAARKNKSRAVRWLIAIGLCLVVGFGAAWGIDAAQASSAEQGAASLRQSILDAANQCAAVEGADPLSLSHLEDCYGVSVNDDVYAVTYEAFATNMPPNVVVKLK